MRLKGQLESFDIAFREGAVFSGETTRGTPSRLIWTDFRVQGSQPWIRHDNGDQGNRFCGQNSVVCVSLHAEIEVRSMNGSTAFPSGKRRVRKNWYESSPIFCKCSQASPLALTPLTIFCASHQNCKERSLNGMSRCRYRASRELISCSRSKGSFQRLVTVRSTPASSVPRHMPGFVIRRCVRLL